MDAVAVFFEGGRAVVTLLLLVFVPGLALSLVIFPRINDLSTIDRLVYSFVMSISSSIASLMFVDRMPGLGLTLENLTLVVGAFSLLLFCLWGFEWWYLDRQKEKHREPKVPEDIRKLPKEYSREVNAAKDLFRQDTRTAVIYHESEQSGMRHIDHFYLLDVAEEIDIQQVAENKLNVTDSFILEPPYPKTQYFELVIHEYNEEGLSLVDDLQIYPVLVTRKPDTDTLHITERIYQKTGSEEIQWIYSHDFHIFAIIHEEDSPDQMVDRILGKLDEIVTSTKSGIHTASPAEDRQILRDAFDTVIKMPRGTPVKPPDIPLYPDVQPFVSSKGIPKRPVILPDIQHEEIPDYPEVPATVPPEIPERPVFHPGSEPEKSPEITRTQPRVLPEEIPERPVVQTCVEPKKIPPRPRPRPPVPPKQTLTNPENKLVVASIRKLQKDILRDLDMFGLGPDSFKKSEKNIEHIPIPKKADVNKKLAKAREEIKDLDWLYE